MKICFVRHGEYDYPGNEKCYVGVTDIPLNQNGRESAYRAADILRICEPGISIYTSPLKRCRETAEIIAGRLGCSGIIVVNDLHEINLGDWEGISIREMKKNNPDGYEERGRNIEFFRTPGGESFHDAGERFKKTVESIELNESGKGHDKVIIVSHRGVILSGIAEISGESIETMLKTNLSYCGVMEFDTDNHSIVFLNERIPDDETIEALYRKYDVPNNVQLHMRKVAQVVDTITDNIDDDILGQSNKKLLHVSAMLHDICRTSRNHSTAGANVLREEGYGDVASLVETHHSGKSAERLDADAILFYADKIVRGNRIVSVDERFAESLKKCRSDEAMDNHTAQYNKAKQIEKLINENMKMTIDELLGGLT